MVSSDPIERRTASDLPRLRGHDVTWDLGAISTGVVIGLLLFLHARHQPLYFDAANYAREGRYIAAHGLFSDWPQSQLRTYGYPLVLAAMARLANILGLELRTLTFVLQLAAYVLASCDLVRVVRRYDHQLAAYLRWLLICNPVLLAFTPELLTDGLSATIVIELLAITGRLLWPNRERGTLLLVAVGLCVGLAIVVRPENSVLLAALAVLVVGYAGSRGHSCSDQGRVRTSRETAITAAAVVLGLGISLSPQLAYNETHFGQLTFLPTAGLIEAQMVAGCADLKFATNVTRGAESPLIKYSNPFFRPSGRMTCLVRHLPGSLAVMSLHAFGALDAEYLTPYIDDLHPWTQGLSVVWSSVFVLLGLYGIWNWVTRRDFGLTPLFCVFSLSIVAGNLGLDTLVQVETRFGFPALVGLSPFVAAGIQNIARGQLRHLIGPRIVTMVCWVIAWSWLSWWLLHQAHL